MPISHDLSDGLIHVTASGQYTFQDIRTGFGAAIRDPRFEDPAPILVDGRSSRHNPSVVELRRIAMFAQTLRPRFDGRAALVVSGALRFGLGRMLQVFAEPYEIEFRVFRDLAQARAWLMAGKPRSPRRSRPLARHEPPSSPLRA